MVNAAAQREELRPQGIQCPACSTCQFRKDCGGFHSGRLFGNCFELTCCHFTGKDKTKCNAVCPYKSDFDDWLDDTRGLRFDDFPLFRQPFLELPWYVPAIDHRYSRGKPLTWPIVALETYDVLRIRRSTGQYSTVADTPLGLRNAFLLGSDTKILLRGVAKDQPLERYWENRRIAHAPEQLSKLAIHAAIGPNFSHFLDAPRTDHLYNKRRQLICLLELVEAGLPTIPHLNAVMPGDWWFWRQFLQLNTAITVVAVEFQTGNKSPAQGRKAIEYLESIQTEINRPLHLILVGGTQFLEFVTTRFSRFTLIDSTPFHKTMHRFHFDHTAGAEPWREGYSLAGQKLDSLLFDNLSKYTAWIEERIQVARGKDPIASSRPSDESVSNLPFVDN
jgi:hypothetical protein